MTNYVRCIIHSLQSERSYSITQMILSVCNARLALSSTLTQVEVGSLKVCELCASFVSHAVNIIQQGKLAGRGAHGLQNEFDSNASWAITSPSLKKSKLGFEVHL